VSRFLDCAATDFTETATENALKNHNLIVLEVARRQYGRWQPISAFSVYLRVFRDYGNSRSSRL